MEIKLNDRKWLESLVSQKTNVIALVDSVPIEKTEENKKKNRKIIAKIIRDSSGKMESIIIEDA